MSYTEFINLPIPVTMRSEARVCGHSVLGIAGSNSAEGTGFRLLCVLCRWQPLR